MLPDWSPSTSARGATPLQAETSPAPHVPWGMASAVAGPVPAAHPGFGLPLSFLAPSQG